MVVPSAKREGASFVIVTPQGSVAWACPMFTEPQVDVMNEAGTNVNCGGVRSGPTVAPGQVSTGSMMPLPLLSGGRVPIAPRNRIVTALPAASLPVASKDTDDVAVLSSPVAVVVFEKRTLNGSEIGSNSSGPWVRNDRMRSTAPGSMLKWVASVKVPRILIPSATLMLRMKALIEPPRNT